MQISASCVPAMWLQAASVLDLEIIWNCLWAEFCMRELFVKSARASLLEFPYTALSTAGDTAPPSSEYWRGGTPRCVMIIVILLVKKWVQMWDNYCIIVPTHWPDYPVLVRGASRHDQGTSSKQCGPLSLVEAHRGSALIGRELHSVAPPVSLMP